MRRWAAPAAVALAMGACGGAETKPPAPAPAKASGRVHRFRVALAHAPDPELAPAGVLDSVRLRRRMTVVAYGTTFDTATHALARFLKQLRRDHAPRVNVLLIVLEPKEHRPIVGAFAEGLGLGYPVGLLPREALREGSGFPLVPSVPSVVLLDRDGREVWRHVGLIDDIGIRAALRQHE